MERLQIWLSLIIGSYLLAAMVVVSLGQPVRPVSHLLKATSFWYLVSWVGLGLGALILGLLR